MRTHAHELVIRPAYPDDGAALVRLAELDEADVPAAPLLLGEVAGELWAAVSASDLAHIAHPFRPSGEIVELLRQRARQLRPRRVGAPRLGLAPRLRSRTARA